jgi:hypothetical protein
MIPLTQATPSAETRRRSSDQPFYYRIRIDGALDPKWILWFDGVDLRVEGDQTFFSGWMPDMAALYGVIDRMRDLGLALLSVERLQPDL